MNRDSNIDFLKAFAILFVVMYHSTTYSFDFLNYGNFSYTYINYFCRCILSTCVPLFFFANGYLLFGREFKLNRHVKKIFSITILTYIWAVIGLCIIGLINKETYDQSTFLYNLKNFLPNGYINHLWYMGALICLYIFYPLLKNSFDSNKVLFLFFLVSTFCFSIFNNLCGILLTLITNNVSYTFNSNFNFFGIFNPLRGVHSFSFFYFCLGGGALIMKKKLENIKFNFKIIYPIILIVLCFNNYLFYYYGKKVSFLANSIYDVVFSGYNTVFTLINVIGLYFLTMKFRRVCIVEMISKNTLCIFFVHNIFIHASTFVWRFVWIRTFYGNVIYASCLVLSCLVLSLIIKKIPVVKYLLKI